MERRLAAIPNTDVVSYSCRMGEDEAGTLAALMSHHTELFDSKASQFNDRTVKLMGDGVPGRITTPISEPSSGCRGIRMLKAARSRGGQRDVLAASPLTQPRTARWNQEH